MSKMRIRCTGCKKKISVDEAFAGGMCRCPYCKAIVKVPDRASSSVGSPDRPDRPDAPPGRPQSPGGRQAPEKATKVKVLGPDDIPMADPVKIQGIVTLLLILCLVAMCSIGGYVVWQITHKPNPRELSWQELVRQGNLNVDTSNPFVANSSAPAVAGNIKVESPIIYVLDCGGSMQEPMGYAAKMVRASVRSLPKDGKFNILSLHDGGNKWMVDGLEFGGSLGVEKAKQETKDLLPSGRTDLVSGIKQAINAKPKTLVFFSKKTIDENDVKDLVSAAKAGGIALIGICFTADTDAMKSYTDVSEKTGGKSKAFGMAELDSLMNKPEVVE